MDQVNIRLQKKFKVMEENEVRYEEYRLDDAEIIITAYGLSSRVCKKTVDIGREEGLKIGLLRPISLWPFPKEKILELALREHVKFFTSIEMSAGQMVEDVQLNVFGKKPVYFYGRMGGIVPTPDEVLDKIKSFMD